MVARMYKSFCCIFSNEKRILNKHEWTYNKNMILCTSCCSKSNILIEYSKYNLFINYLVTNYKFVFKLIYCLFGVNIISLFNFTGQLSY